MRSGNSSFSASVSLKRRVKGCAKSKKAVQIGEVVGHFVPTLVSDQVELAERVGLQLYIVFLEQVKNS